MLQKIIQRSLWLIYFAVLISSGLCCTSDEWKCGSGQCIVRSDLCDGKFDCLDQSDETEEECLHINCPEYAFKCAYGACVSGKAEGNGVQQCVDNSDETHSKPITNQDLNQDTDSTYPCDDLEILCTSKECISLEKSCDGPADCEDQSDETFERCSQNSCEEHQFRCNYGACINMEKTCDGHFDCRDFSDESPKLCGTTIPITKSQPQKQGCTAPSIDNGGLTYDSSPNIIIPSNTLLPDITIVKYMCNRGYQLKGESINLCFKLRWLSSHPICESIDTDCKVPYIPNFKFKNKTNGNYLQPGDIVQDRVEITYECKGGYNRVGHQFNICKSSKWKYPLYRTRCIKYCSPKELEDISFEPTCKKDDTVISCKDRIEPNTTAEINCAIQYRSTRAEAQLLTCGDDGFWDNRPEPCQELCGIKKQKSQPFMLGGTKSNITDVPWHVAIYSRLSDLFTYICGGNIISARLVISAAHCFLDNETQTLLDITYFTVGAGKIYREYHLDKEDAQFQNISEIFIPNGFDPFINNYNKDLAVLKVMQFFKLNPNIAPVCIEKKYDGEKEIVDSQSGIIGGWGKLEFDEANITLRTSIVTALSYNSCKETVSKTFHRSIETDKFCIINKNGVTPCKGDSGGGFVVEKIVGKQTKHYLWGIISTGILQTLSCKDTEFVTLTNIHFYDGFIRNIMLK